MVHHDTNGDEQAQLLQQLYPIFELTPLIRPRLLIASTTVEHVPIVLGLLYHRSKDAYQSRLRFRAANQPEYIRRTRWRRFASAAQVNATIQRIERQFTTLAASVGGRDILKVQFPLRASDAMVLQRLLASGIPALFP
jgi:hypothetical protein